MNYVDTTRLSYQDAEQIPQVAEALALLERELDPRYTYHTANHTRVVLADALMLAHAEGCSHHEQVLVALAAAFHDVGYLDRATHNEEFGARRARIAMEEGGYSSSDITAVEQMILDTSMVQSIAGVLHMPRHVLSPYLLDADLANLGRASFWDQFELIRKELGIDRETMIAQTIKLFESHRWLTRTAGELWKAQARKNLDALRAAGHPAS